MQVQGKVFESGSAIYIVSPVSIHEPTPEEIKGFKYGEELARTSELKDRAPNPNILWMHGQYVEADNPNLNKQMWTAGDLAIAHLTPRFMPITVMHDPSTAVGLIADTALRLPANDQVPRSRIDTELALWRHRFPDVAEEAIHNAQNGALMQSMECLPSSYDCAQCGTTYHPMPGHAEREFWCAHLDGSLGEKAVRILRGVTFTGTGLIFGSRGARGAYTEAHLEVEELAAFHEQLLTDNRTSPRRPSRMGLKQIEESEYERIIRERDESARKLTEETARADAADAKVEEAEKKVESVEAAKVKAETEAADEKKRADKAEEEANQTKLRDERTEKFGAGFKARLEKAPTTRDRLLKQAATMSDEDWSARLEELEETLGVKRDAKDDSGGSGGEGGTPSKDEEAGLFTREEVAGAGLGEPSGATEGQPTSDRARRSVIGGLARGMGKQPAAKSD